MARRFFTADVFTARPFGGNPLAVVLDAEDLDDDAMMRIAREFNFSETTFVLPPKGAENTARVRIFTPARELPFAGHPTVGTAIVLAELSLAEGAPFETEVWLEETVGVLRVTVTRGAEGPAYAEFAAAHPPFPAGGALAPERAAAALSLAPEDVAPRGEAIRAFSAGTPFVFVPVRSPDALARAVGNAAAWPTPDDVGGATSFYAYAESGDRRTMFRARKFGLQRGAVVEDPATGAAAAALPGHVHAHAPLADGEHAWVVEQGIEMGRPSEIRVTAAVEEGRLARVRIGGHAVRMSDGALRV